MAEAVVGDDVFGDDPTVLELQDKVAKLLKKEAGLFVPTGYYPTLTFTHMHYCFILKKKTQFSRNKCYLYYIQGTMGNLISVMSHCWGRGLEVILGDKSHIHIYEQGGIAQVRIGIR